MCFVHPSYSFSVSVSVSQGLGGGLQSDLLITPWLTLSLTLWWGLMDAGILWKVRRQQTKRGIVASRMHLALATKYDMKWPVSDQGRNNQWPKCTFSHHQRSKHSVRAYCLWSITWNKKSCSGVNSDKTQHTFCLLNSPRCPTGLILDSHFE